MAVEKYSNLVIPTVGAWLTVFVLVELGTYATFGRHAWTI